ncbi:hypothetical protein [Roseovarius sp. D0-M9]|uniref:hypothetical protein n=1 Tax=Roseovarius sp. D0-M9 TaxID=3127117 RepID=UPI00300FF84F
MEKLILEIEAYCASAGIKPQKLLRDAVGAGWGQWAAWKANQSSPTMAVVDRVRAHMAEGPPENYKNRKRRAAA